MIHMDMDTARAVDMVDITAVTATVDMVTTATVMDMAATTITI